MFGSKDEPTLSKSEIDDYDNITADTMSALNGAVRKRIREGWIPVGGIWCHEGPTAYSQAFTQTMIICKTI